MKKRLSQVAKSNWRHLGSIRQHTISELCGKSQNKNKTERKKSKKKYIKDNNSSEESVDLEVSGMLPALKRKLFN